MTDDELEAELASLSPEEREQVAHRMQMSVPVRLAVAFGVQSISGSDGSSAVMLMLQTPAGSQRTVLSREEALAVASQLRKAAQTGPQLVTVPRLVVPR